MHKQAQTSGTPTPNSTDLVYNSIMKQRLGSRIKGDQDNMTPIEWEGFSQFNQNISYLDPSLIKEDKYRTKIPRDVLKRLQRRPASLLSSPRASSRLTPSILQNPRLYQRDNKIQHKVLLISNQIEQQKLMQLQNLSPTKDGVKSSPQKAAIRLNE